jgi:hypothetical protein
MSACSTSQPTVLLDSRLVCISRVWVGFVSGFTAVARVLLEWTTRGRLYVCVQTGCVYLAEQAGLVRAGRLYRTNHFSQPH